MSTYSTNLALTLIGNGEQSGLWGTTTNTNLGTLIEQAISGYVEYACTGGTDTITIPNGATGVARNMYLELTGTGGGTLVVPANKKLYFIYNNTASGAVTVKVSGQTGVSVANGNRMSLVCNGTDIVDAITYIQFSNVDVTSLTATNLTATNFTVGKFTFTEASSNLAISTTQTYTASISSTTMTVTSATVGTVVYGQAISGTGVTGGTTVAAQLTSTETSAASKTYYSGGASGDTVFEINSVSSVAVGQMISGTGIPAGTYVISLDGAFVYLGDRTGAPVALTTQASGTYEFKAAGGKGTYTVSASQTVLSTTITGTKKIATLSPNGTFTVLGNATSNASLT